MKTVFSPDSQAFILRHGTQVIYFNYGLKKHEGAACTLTDIADISSLENLPCFSLKETEEGEKINVSIIDPIDSNFSLVISKKQCKDDDALFAVVKAIKFVGKKENVKLISIDKSQKFSTIMDESGKSRIVKKGDIIMRNFGTLRRIEKKFIRIEEVIIDESGDCQKRQIILMP